MVADLVGDHIGLGEVAGGGEALFHLAEELQVEVDPAVGRTVERPGGRRGEAAGGIHPIAEQHQLGLLVLCLAAGEDLFPGVLGVAEDRADELALLVVAAGARPPACCWVAGAGLSIWPSSDPRICIGSWPISRPTTTTMATPPG